MAGLVAPITTLGCLPNFHLWWREATKKCCWVQGLSLMGDESSQRADGHYDFIEFVLSVSGKDKSNVVALVGDNNNTNRVFACLFERVYVGCHSNHFTLTVKDKIQKHQDFVNGVHQLMQKLSFSVPVVLLRQKTPLAAKWCNMTRWKCAIKMRHKYV